MSIWAEEAEETGGDGRVRARRANGSQAVAAKYIATFLARAVAFFFFATHERFWDGAKTEHHCAAHIIIASLLWESPQYNPPIMHVHMGANLLGRPPAA